MVRSIIVVSLMAFAINTDAQEKTTGDKILEGSKIVVDLWKNLKPEKKEESQTKKLGNCMDGKHSNLCYENQKDYVIRILLKDRNEEKTYELIIPSKGQECRLYLPSGVYEYEIQNANQLNILRKGDILLETCKDRLEIIK